MNSDKEYSGAQFEMRCSDSINQGPETAEEGRCDRRLGRIVRPAPSRPAVQRSTDSRDCGVSNLSLPYNAR
jgi:hypothetical protein